MERRGGERESYTQAAAYYVNLARQSGLRRRPCLHCQRDLRELQTFGARCSKNEPGSVTTATKLGLPSRFFSGVPRTPQILSSSRLSCRLLLCGLWLRGPAPGRQHLPPRPRDPPRLVPDHLDTRPSGCLQLSSV